MPGLSLKLIIGLGNPGEEYARTRHNAGFGFVEELARRHGGAFRLESRHHGELARIRIGAADLWLLEADEFHESQRQRCAERCRLLQGVGIARSSSPTTIWICRRALRA
jgi:peptidyl-tRNA hydrolase